jgi:hypothetical protein
MVGIRRSVDHAVDAEEGRSLVWLSHGPRQRVIVTWLSAVVLALHPLSRVDWPSVVRWFSGGRSAKLAAVNKRTIQTSSSARPAPVTGGETRAKLLQRARRTAAPLRKVFVQLPKDSTVRPGMLAPFVTAGDLRGLRAYLIIVAASSGQNDQGWTTELDSFVWARLFDAHLHADHAIARTAAWRTLTRLQDKGLITCSRTKGSRNIAVTLLREDGTRAPYTRPGVSDKDAYLQLPIAFWTKGYDEKVNLPGMAMLLAICAARSWAAFPAEWMPTWYGWSPDTTLRGLKILCELGLIEQRKRYKKAELTAVGSTMFYEYRPARFMRATTQARPAGVTA